MAYLYASIELIQEYMLYTYIDNLDVLQMGYHH